MGLLLINILLGDGGVSGKAKREREASHNPLQSCTPDSWAIPPWNHLLLKPGSTLVRSSSLWDIAAASAEHLTGRKDWIPRRPPGSSTQSWAPCEEGRQKWVRPAPNTSQGTFQSYVIYNACDGMNIVNVMSLIVKVIIKCGYHVLYNSNDGIHITPVISYTVSVMSSKERVWWHMEWKRCQF